MVHNFIHIQIGVTDLEKAGKFYSKIFNWKVKNYPEMPNLAIYEITEDGEFVGGGFMLVEGKPSTGTTQLYVNTEDINSKLDEIEKLGGKRLLEKTELPGGHGFVGRFEDPFGNVIGLWTET
ncbi:MAG: VOC family protein [Candidatus Kariarchaeaceae archaeon]|jgi:predicted enzyme related to lactoylglutathione lyase